MIATLIRAARRIALVPEERPFLILAGLHIAWGVFVASPMDTWSDLPAYLGMRATWGAETLQGIACAALGGVWLGVIAGNAKRSHRLGLALVSALFWFSVLASIAAYRPESTGVATYGYITACCLILAYTQRPGGLEW